MAAVALVGTLDTKGLRIWVQSGIDRAGWLLVLLMPVANAVACPK